MANIKRNETLLCILKTSEAESLIDITGASYSYLRLIAYGHKQPSARVASLLELATAGRVTRRELRPNDWQEIWPELADEYYNELQSRMKPIYTNKSFEDTEVGRFIREYVAEWNQEIEADIKDVLSAGDGETITPAEAALLFQVTEEQAAMILSDRSLLALFSRCFFPLANFYG